MKNRTTSVIAGAFSALVVAGLFTSCGTQAEASPFEISHEPAEITPEACLKASGTPFESVDEEGGGLSFQAPSGASKDEQQAFSDAAAACQQSILKADEAGVDPEVEQDFVRDYADNVVRCLEGQGIEAEAKDEPGQPGVINLVTPGTKQDGSEFQSLVGKCSEEASALEAAARARLASN